MEKIIKLQIEGMHCGSCEKIIEMELLDLHGVKSAKIDSGTKTGKVIVEEGKVNEEMIVSAIVRAGYKATVVRDSDANIVKTDGEKGEIILEKK